MRPDLRQRRPKWTYGKGINNFPFCTALLAYLGVNTDKLPAYKNSCVSCEKRANRTNSTFGFCRHTGKPKKPKELVFSQRSNEN